MCRFILACLLPLTATATPIEMAYQGRIFEGDGTPLEGPVQLTLKLYADDVTTTAVHTETFDVVLDSGVFAVVLGSESTLDNSVLDRPEVWVGTTIGTQDETTPRMRLLSTPYAALAHGLASGATAAGPLVLGPPTPGSCTASTAGAIAYNPTMGAVVVCDGSNYATLDGQPSVGGTAAVLSNGVYEWEDGTYAASCLDYLSPSQGYESATTNGIYRLEPTPGTVFEAYCDQAGGGWTLIAKTAGGSDVWAYDSTLWSTSNTLSASSTGLAAGDVKLNGYNTLPVSAVRGCVTTPTTNCVDHTFSSTRSSALAVFNGSESREGVDRIGFEDTFGVTGQQNCSSVEYGFNVSAADGVHVRWGTTNNIPSQGCGAANGDSDAALGWGVKPQSGDCGPTGAGWSNYYNSNNECGGSEASFNSWLWVR